MLHGMSPKSNRKVGVNKKQTAITEKFLKHVRRKLPCITFTNRLHQMHSLELEIQNKTLGMVQVNVLNDKGMEKNFQGCRAPLSFQNLGKALQLENAGFLLERNFHMNNLEPKKRKHLMLPKIERGNLHICISHCAKSECDTCQVTLSGVTSLSTEFIASINHEFMIMAPGMNPPCFGQSKGKILIHWIIHCNDFIRFGVVDGQWASLSGLMLPLKMMLSSELAHCDRHQFYPKMNQLYIQNGEISLVKLLPWLVPSQEYVCVIMQHAMNIITTIQNEAAKMLFKKKDRMTSLLHPSFCLSQPILTTLIELLDYSQHKVAPEYWGFSLMFISFGSCFNSLKAYCDCAPQAERNDNSERDSSQAGLTTMVSELSVVCWNFNSSLSQFNFAFFSLLSLLKLNWLLSSHFTPISSNINNSFLYDVFLLDQRNQVIGSPSFSCHPNLELHPVSHPLSQSPNFNKRNRKESKEKRREKALFGA
ncbi:hypothetical protein VP01_1256g4 [Puccinia sorghi]|uniref:Uncharacterized protein n=1 Tax=Puccinia sorghi TaxID=27349 RepID=A0A0L6VP89_9BASI|nr:hypothetical protein VP01_1256g4 [Puccinia sorghi]